MKKPVKPKEPKAKKPAAAKKPKAKKPVEAKPVTALAVPGTLYDGANPIIDGKPRCGAKKRKKDGICMSTNLMPNRKCRLHGGKTPHGVASPNFKHGRFSKYMPEHLAARYGEYLHDPELVSNRDNLAYLDVLISEKLEGIYKGFPADAWLIARELYNNYIAALNWTPKYDFNQHIIEVEPDPEPILQELGRLLGQGLRVANAFNEMEPLLESHRKHVDTEYKRLKDLNTKLDTSEVIAIARALVDAVKRHVRDPKQLAAIQADVSRIIS